MLDILYGEFVSMLWHSCAPTLHPERVGRRPQPDWWDGECYDAMVGKNAAWRRWCCERTPAAQQALRAKRLHFHHLVRKKKAIFWHTWLQSQEHATQSNPCIAARNIRRQLGTSRHSVPRCMRSASPECNYVEGEACLEAWRCHFRDVPASAVPGPRESGVDAQISVGCVNKRLVRPAGWIIRSLNPNLCKFFKNCLEESAGSRRLDI